MRRVVRIESSVEDWSGLQLSLNPNDEDSECVTVTEASDEQLASLAKTCKTSPQFLSAVAWDLIYLRDLMVEDLRSLFDQLPK